MEGDKTLALHQLSNLIGGIYDCALDPSLWRDVLAGIGEWLAFGQVTLTLQAMPSGTVMLSVASGIPEPWFERSTAYGAEVIAMWGGLARIAATPLEEPVLLSAMNPEVCQGTVHNAFHAEWYRPQGLADSAAVGLIRDANSLASISLTRRQDQGAIGSADMDAIRLLAPHLRRAVTISRLLDAQTVAAATVEAALDRTGTPILVTDGLLNLLHANAPARTLLDARDPLIVKGHGIALAQPAAMQALSLAVAQAAEDEAEIGHRGLGIPVLCRDGTPRVLHVLPLRGGALRPGLVNKAAAAIFVSTAAASPVGAGSLAAQLFGLSLAEARIFDLIAEGHTPAEAATRLDIGLSTVRTHLLRIYAKTGTRRQSDLVRLAASLILPGA